AEQVAELFAQVSMAQSVNTQVMSSGQPFKSWQEVVRVTAALGKNDPDRTLVENLLTSQWAKGTIKVELDVSKVLRAWQSVRALCAGGRHASAAA
ncbi:MAG: hypothetical protein ACKPEA_05165, partial [Planctomycetota bacterium]